MQIDIHAGGEDLIFPHHENEIAQSEAANGKTFAQLLDAQWLFKYRQPEDVQIPADNFFTVREIGAKYDLAGAALLHAERPLPQPDQLQRRAYGGC